MTIILRPRQRYAIEETKRLLRTGLKRILIVGPTGTGKRSVFCKGVVEPAVSKGSTAWVIVNRKQLVQQTSDELERLGIDHGVMQARHWRTNHAKPIQICSKDTLRNRVDQLTQPDIIICDEAHHVTDDNSWGDIVQRFPKAVVLGFTATPCRLDGKGLGGVFQEMVVFSTISQEIRDGYLVPPRIFASRKLPDLKRLPKSGGDYNLLRLAERMDRTYLTGNVVSEWQKHASDRPTIGFAVNINHSMHVVEQFTNAGVAAAHIDHSTPDELRQRHIEALRAGRIQVLMSVGVFTEGFDCPQVGAVILARPSASLSLFIQMAGRGLRPAKGIAEPGENCIFLDHAGFTKRGWLITDEQEWSLHGGLVQKTKGAPLLYHCPFCMGQFKTWPMFCPHCGEKLADDAAEANKLPEVKEEALVEVDPALVAERTKARRKQVYAGLARKFHRLGRAAVSVNLAFKTMFGEWPSQEDTLDADIYVTFRRNPDGIRGSWVYERRTQ